MIDIPSFPYVGRESYNLSEQPVASVSSIAFGDSYKMDSPRGIRPVMGKWSVEYLNVPNDIGDAIYSFILGLKFAYPFLWTHPKSGIVYTVKCRESPNRKYSSGFHQTITATYEEV